LMSNPRAVKCEKASHSRGVMTWSLLEAEVISEKELWVTGVLMYEIDRNC
jgi:hypothetical protein